jgi:hypothetical protein
MPYNPGQYTNPLNKNIFWKHEKHNAGRVHCLYDTLLTDATNIYGVTVFYYPVSEYNLDSLTSVFGEDVNVSYSEKYTMKVLPEQGGQDTFQINSFGGIDKSESERIVYIPKEMFTAIVGRENPLPSDWMLYTQNNIIYEVLEIDDNEGIVAGKELYWKVTLMPRLVEGEKIASCDKGLDVVIDPTPEEYCESLDLEFNNDGQNAEVPAPTLENDDNDKIEEHRNDINIIRNSMSNDWGNGIDNNW